MFDAIASRHQERKIKRVVLISLYLFDSVPVRCLHSFVARHGYSVDSIFLKEYYPETKKNPTAREIGLLIDTLRQLHPDVVGISVGSPFEDVARTITAHIRRQMDPIIVWGGAYPTLMPEDCLTYADYVFVGEGEETFVTFLDRLNEGIDVSGCKGIWMKKDNAVVNNGFTLNESADFSVFADFSNEHKYYIENDRIGKKVEDVVGISHKVLMGTHAFTQMYHIITKKDCIYQCSYCPDGALRNLYAHVQFKRRSVDNVIAELRHAQDTIGIKAVCFHDDIFTVNEAWVGEFTRKYSAGIRLPFMINSHFFHFHDRMLADLKNAGLRVIRVGIQSGSARSNKLFHRPFDRAKVVAMAELIHRHAIYPIYDIIVNNPFEDDADKQATYDLLIELPRPFKLYIHPFMLYPRSHIVKYAREKNLVGQCRTGSIRTHFYRLMSRESPEDAFWNPLCWLTTVTWFPKRYIRLLRQASFLRRHPFFLKLFCGFIHLGYGNRMISKIRFRNRVFQNV